MRRSTRALNRRFADAGLRQGILQSATVAVACGGQKPILNEIAHPDVQPGKTLAVELRNDLLRVFALDEVGADLGLPAGNALLVELAADQRKQRGLNRNLLELSGAVHRRTADKLHDARRDGRAQAAGARLLNRLGTHGRRAWAPAACGFA